VDAEGHASNSNETEQIVVVPRSGAEKGEEVFSYVQTRGSVPVFWSQVNTLRYVPDLQVMDKPSTVRLSFRPPACCCIAALLTSRASPCPLTRSGRRRQGTH
jgi:hypothetical protein